MPGIFDNFNASQANNGQAQPNPQVASGAPGFQFGSWGNQPPNMAGGLQQFLATRGMARPQPGAQPPQPGMFGAQAPTSQPPAVMPQQSGMPMNASQPSSAAIMPQAASATGPTGDFSSQMQPFLGARTS